MYVYSGSPVVLRGPFQADVLALTHAVIKSESSFDIQDRPFDRIWRAANYRELQDLIAEFRIPVVWR